VAVWPSDNGSSHEQSYTMQSSVSTEITVRCVTIYQYTTLVYQPLRLTQPPTFSGKGNEYWSRESGSAIRWEGNRRSGLAPAERHRICHISTYRLNSLKKGVSTPLTLLF